MSKTAYKIADIDLDPTEEAFSFVECALRVLVPNPSARKVLGLQKVSEIMAGDPGWYLWLQNCPGAFAIQLANAAILCESDAAREWVRQEQFSVLGSWHIRYFPRPGEPCFQEIPKQQQDQRKSRFFDDTGTPAVGEESGLAPQDYLAGLLETNHERSGHGFQMVLSTLIKGRNRKSAGQSKSSCHHAAFDAFRFIARAICIYLQAAPKYLAFWESGKTNRNRGLAQCIGGSFSETSPSALINTREGPFSDMILKRAHSQENGVVIRKPLTVPRQQDIYNIRDFDCLWRSYQLPIDMGGVPYPE